MGKRILWFFIGMISSFVLVIGGVLGASYLIAKNSSINSLEDKLGYELPILIEDPEDLRDRNLIDLAKYVMDLVQNPDTTFGDLRGKLGLGDLITDDYMGVDFRPLDDVKIREYEDAGVEALFDGITLRVLTTTGMDVASNFAFLADYKDYPLVDLLRELFVMPLGAFLQNDNNQSSNDIVSALMFTEDDAGEFVKWTDSNGNQHYVKYEDFNVNRQYAVKFQKITDNEYRICRNPAPNSVYYICIAGEYITNAEAQAYYSELATAQRYYGLTIMNPEFDRIINNITLGSVITIEPNNLLYELRDVKLSGLGEGVDNLVDNLAIASVITVKQGDGIVESIAMTETDLANAYVLNADGEYVAYTGTFEAGYSDGVFFKKPGEDDYVAYFVVGADSQYVTSVGVDLSTYAGNFYKATTVMEISGKVSDITVLDALGGVAKVNEDSIIQAIAFAPWTESCGYTGKLYKKTINPTGDPEYLFEVAEDGYEGTTYYPVKATDISSRVGSITIRDVLGKPAETDNKLIKAIWREGEGVAIGDIGTVINKLGIQDVIEDPGEDGNGILKKIYDKNPSLNPDSEHSFTAVFSDLLDEIEVADVIQLDSDSSSLMKALLYEPCYKLSTVSDVQNISIENSVNYFVVDNADTVIDADGNKKEKHVCLECLQSDGDDPTIRYDLPADYTLYEYLTVGDITDGVYDGYFYYDETEKVYKPVTDATASTYQVYHTTKVTDIETRMNEIRLMDVFPDMSTESGIGILLSKSTLVVNLADDLETHVNMENMTVEKLLRFSLSGEDALTPDEYLINKGITSQDDRDTIKAMTLEGMLDLFLSGWDVLKGAGLINN